MHAETGRGGGGPGIWHMESLQKTASKVLGSNGSGFEASIT